MLVVPVAFASDHLETLFELGIEYRHLAENAGVEQYEITTGLNDSPRFIEALSQVVLAHLGHDAGQMASGAAN
jgi:ferrochelatase